MSVHFFCPGLCICSAGLVYEQVLIEHPVNACLCHCQLEVVQTVGDFKTQPLIDQWFCPVIVRTNYLELNGTAGQLVVGF